MQMYLCFWVVTDDGVRDIALEIENTLWADTVLASGTAIGCVIYTGPETRSAMNANKPTSKVIASDLSYKSLLVQKTSRLIEIGLKR